MTFETREHGWIFDCGDVDALGRIGSVIVIYGRRLLRWDLNNMRINNSRFPYRLLKTKEKDIITRCYGSNILFRKPTNVPVLSKITTFVWLAVCKAAPPPFTRIPYFAATRITKESTSLNHIIHRQKHITPYLPSRP